MTACLAGSFSLPAVAGEGDPDVGATGDAVAGAPVTVVVVVVMTPFSGFLNI